MYLEVRSRTAQKKPVLDRTILFECREFDSLNKLENLVQNSLNFRLKGTQFVPLLINSLTAYRVAKIVSDKSHKSPVSIQPSNRTLVFLHTHSCTRRQIDNREISFFIF